MKTCAVTWFRWSRSSVIMSERGLRTLKTLETIEVQEIQPLQ